MYNSVTKLTELYEQAIKHEKGSFITSSGALATLSGAKTGRSPRDKRVVRDETTEHVLWWGKYVFFHLSRAQKNYFNFFFILLIIAQKTVL